MSFFYRNKEFFTEIDLAMCAISGKVKPAILYELLQESPLRLSEIERKLPDINQRMLIRQIKELEADGLIKRTEYPVVPPKVDYQLTDLGETLRASLEPLHQWGAYLL